MKRGERGIVFYATTNLRNGRGGGSEALCGWTHSWWGGGRGGGGCELMIMHWKKCMRRNGREGYYLTQQLTFATAYAGGGGEPMDWGLGDDNDA